MSRTQKDALAEVQDKLKAIRNKNSIEIDGKVYKIDLLKAGDGIELWEELMKIVLPSVGSGLDALRSSGQRDELFDGPSTTITEIMIHLSNKLDGTRLKWVSDELLGDMTCDGVPVDFDEHFKGNYGTWLKLIRFALTENFSSFFADGWVQEIMGTMDRVMPAEPEDYMEEEHSPS